MSGGMEFGIRITADGKVASAEVGRAEEALRRVGDTADQVNRKVETSAKQAAFAMRQLPMQMTDVAVGLASGQSPFMVLMQQGGQLKDTFGGIGPAVRAVGGYVAGLVNPFTVAAAAAGGLAAAYVAGQREAESYARAIILTGNAAGATVSQLQAAAAQAARMAGDTVGNTAEAIAALVGTGKVAADNLAVVADAAVRLERVGVQSLDVTVKQFEALGQKPVEASLKLNEQTNYLTADLYKQIKALEDQGRASEAAALAQKTYADEMKKRSQEVEASLGTLERKWLAVKRASGMAIDVVLGLGAKKNIDDQIAMAESALRNAQAGFRGKGDIPALEAELARLRREKGSPNATADANRKEELDHARAYADLQTRLSGTSKSFTADLRTLHTEYERGGMTIEDYRAKVTKLIQTETEIGRERSTTKKVDNGVDDFKREQAKQYANLYEAGLKYAEGVDLQLAADHKLTEGEKILGIAKKALADDQYALVEALLQGVIAREHEARVVELQTKAAQESNSALRGEIDTLTLHNQEIGLSEKQLNALILARMDNAIAMAEEKYRTTELTDANADYVSALADQIRLLRERRNLVAAGQGLQESANKTQEYARAQADMWQSIDRTAHDVWVDVSNNGVSAFERIGKTIQASVLDLLYQITIKRWLIQLAVGVGGEGGAIGGIGNAGNYLSGANSLYSAYTGATTSMLASGIGYVGSALGSTTMTGFAAGMQGSSLAAGLAGPTTAGAGGAMGAGAAFASAVPYIAAAIAVLSMVDWGGGTPHAGGSAYSSGNGYTTPSTEAGIRAYYADSGVADQMVMKDWTKRFDQTTANALGTASEGFARTFNEIVTANGLSGGYQFGLAFSADGEDPVRARSTILDASGNQIAWTKDYNRLGDDPQQGLQLMLTEQVPKLMLTALEGMDLNALANSFLDSLDIEHLSAEAAQQALNFVASTDEIIAALGHLGIGADEVTTQLIQSLGGIDAAITKLDAYYQSFYSEDRRNANATADMTAKFSALGLVMPLTTEGFVDLMDSLDLTTESGRATYAQLLQLSPQFLVVADAAQKAAQAWAGFDAAGLGQMMLDAAFNPAAGKTSAESFAVALDSSVRNALISSTVGNVATMIYNAIIVPMVAGAVVSQAAIDTVVQKAQAAVTSLGTVLRELDLSSITSVVSSLLPSIANFAPQAGAAQSSAAQQAVSAADTISASWQDMADSIVDTARRLRGDLLNEADNYAKLQADFAIATAAARAGDDVAAGKLSDLAASVVEAAKLVSVTGADYNLVAARTIASLNTTAETLHDKYGVKIPTFADGGWHSGGYAIVGESGPELAYMPPSRIYSNSDSQSLLDIGPLVAEIRRLDTRLATIERHTESTAKATNGEGRAPVLVEMA